MPLRKSSDCTAPGSSNRPVRAIGRRAWPILVWVIGKRAQFWIGRQFELFGFGRRQPINVLLLGREAEPIKRAGTLKRCRRVSKLISKLLAPELGRRWMREPLSVLARNCYRRFDSLGARMEKEPQLFSMTWRIPHFGRPLDVRAHRSGDCLNNPVFGAAWQSDQARSDGIEAADTQALGTSVG